MIWIDPRRGSGELKPLFSSFSIPTELEYLDSADFFLCGRGVDKDNRPQEVAIGIERKAMGDFLDCMDDARFVGYQMDKMLSTYNFPIICLEGTYRPSDDGYIEELYEIHRDGKPLDIFKWRKVYRGRKTVLFSALSGHLNTLRLRAGLYIVETSNKLHTAWFVANLYKWFNDKSWDEHRSHLRIYDPASTLGGKSSFIRKFAMQIPGIGYDKSALVEQAFPGTLGTLEMFLSNEEIAILQRDPSIWDKNTARVAARWAGIKWQAASGRNMSLGEQTSKRVTGLLRGCK